MKISAVVLTKNEETNIKRCLASLLFCDELLVIDDYSSDQTGMIAQDMGAKVIKRHLDSDWAKQRNFAIENAKYDWILFVDADEVISEKLQKEIISTLASTTSMGFAFNRQDYFLGKLLRHGETANVRLVRLGKKGAGQWTRKVHEYWDIKNVEKLKNPIMHYPHKSLRAFVTSVNTMTQIHAAQNLSEGKKATIFKVIFWPLFKFVQNYIFRFGFLDGVHGFVFAVMMSFHSFLAWSNHYLKRH